MSGTTIYAYDLDNRLRTVNLNGAITTFGYSPDGLMNKMVPAGVVTNLLYDGDKLAAESNASSTVLKRYVHGPGIDEPLVAYESSTTASKSWLYADHQGSIIAQANGAGSSTATYSYGPFGEANTSSGVRFRYTGQQYIPALNLYYYKARFYSPALGRFLQTDPIGYQDDMNLYAYVGNDPLNRTDPTGENKEAIQALRGILSAPNPYTVAFIATFTSPSLNANESQELAGMGIPYFSENAATGGNTDHADERAKQAKSDPDRQVGDKNKVVANGKKYIDNDSGNIVHVDGDRVVITDVNGKPITQFKNSRANTNDRINSGRWEPM